MIIDIDKIQKAADRLPELDKEFQELKEKMNFLNSTESKPILSTKDIKEHLQCSTQTAYKIMDAVGKLNVGSKNYVVSEDFWKYLSEQKQISEKEIKSRARKYINTKVIA